MKKTMLFLLPVLGLFSCKDDAKPDDCGVELKLVQTIGSFTPNPTPVSGDDMSWQESIVLLNDSSFVKRYAKDGVTSEEGGIYAYATMDNRSYIQLTYTNAKNPLIESCSSASSEEWIQIVSDTEFKNTSWSACDGPTLVYEKTTVSCQD